MTLGTVLQAIITIIFIYLILALFTSELQEYLTTVFEARAKRLKQSIRQMLGEQDYPYFRLEINEKYPKKGDWVWLQDGKISVVTPENVLRWLDGTTELDGSQVIQEGSTENYFVKGHSVTKKDQQKNVWLDETTELDGSQVIQDGSTGNYFVKGNSVKKNEEPFIFIKETGNSVVNPQNLITDSDNNWFVKGETLTQFPVYEGADQTNPTKCWTKKPNAIKTANYNQPFIWIQDSDGAEISEQDVTPDASDPTVNNKGTVTSSGLPVTKHLVYSEKGNSNNKVWIKPDDIKKIDDPNFTNSSVFVKGDDSVVDEAEIIKRSPGEFYIKGEPIKKIPVAQIKADPVVKQNESPVYLWDKDNKKIFNAKQVLLASFAEKPTSKECDFLTDKLYAHPNIQALNQSSSSWRSLWSLMSDSWNIFCSQEISNNSKEKSDCLQKLLRKAPRLAVIIGFILSVVGIILILLTFSLPNFNSFLLPSIALFLLPFMGLTCFYLINEDKYGQTRKSVGPSYIEDSNLFAETLIWAINENSSTITPNDISSTLNALKFYTPAISTLKKMAFFSGKTTEADFKTFLKEQYENVQKRSSGSYKRNSKGLSFLIGLLIAVSLNADTFNIIANLTQKDNTTASKLVAELDKNPDSFKDCKGDTTCEKVRSEAVNKIFNSIDTLPLGWPDTVQQQIAAIDNEIETLRKNIQFLEGENLKKFCSETADQSKSTETCFEKTKELLKSNPNDLSYFSKSMIQNIIEGVNKKDGAIDTQKVSAFRQQYVALLKQNKEELERKQIKKVALLNGADSSKTNSTDGVTQQINNTVNKQGGWLKTALGWLITAIALSMGAPFWFDLLGKVMNVRNATKSVDLGTKKTENSGGSGDSGSS